jgi:hypothetical protein
MGLPKMLHVVDANAKAQSSASHCSRRTRTNLSTEFVLQLEHYPILEIIGKINVNTLAHNYTLSISTV